MRFHHPGTSQLSGKVKLILLGFPTTYFPEQGLCQVLHKRNKYRSRLDMSNNGETSFKLTNFQPALKKLADNTIARFALVGMSCFLEINIYSTNAFAFVLFCAD